MTLIVNLFGGPGSGKSTMAAALFAELKCSGLNCELATEYAKDMVWEESMVVISNQIYIFAQQLHRIYRLLNKVDVVITDSPLLLSLHYGNKYSYIFKALVLEQHNQLNNWNIFLDRKGRKFNPVGRIHTEEQSQECDKNIQNILDSNYIDYAMVPSHIDAIPEIAKAILQQTGDLNVGA